MGRGGLKAGLEALGAGQAAMLCGDRHTSHTLLSSLASKKDKRLLSQEIMPSCHPSGVWPYASPHGLAVVRHLLLGPVGICSSAAQRSHNAVSQVSAFI